LLPERGELSATVFVELTTEEDLRHWLPRLVGIERALAFELGDPTATVVPSVPESTHAQALTRETVTAAVHYVRFVFPVDARARVWAGEPMVLAVRHPEYEARAVLPEAVHDELAGDLEGRTELVPLG
ncbi:MAG: DUF3501 family protein, partial [Acidimicrobiales bacterium]